MKNSVEKKYPDQTEGEEDGSEKVSNQKKGNQTKILPENTKAERQEDGEEKRNDRKKVIRIERHGISTEPQHRVVRTELNQTPTPAARSKRGKEMKQPHLKQTHDRAPPWTNAGGR